MWVQSGRVAGNDGVGGSSGDGELTPAESTASLPPPPKSCQILEIGGIRPEAVCIRVVMGLYFSTGRLSPLAGAGCPECPGQHGACWMFFTPVVRSSGRRVRACVSLVGCRRLSR